MYKSVWVIIKVGEEVLLLKRGKKANNPNLWNFPGGGVEKNETLKTSAIREVWEEAGIRIKESDLIFTHREEKSKRILYYYTVELKKKPIIKINKESAKYKWVTWDDFPKYLHKPTRFYYKKVLNKPETASSNVLELLINKVLSYVR